MTTATTDVAASLRTAAEYEQYALSLIEQGRNAEAIPVIGEIIYERDKRAAAPAITTRWLERMAFCLVKTKQPGSAALLLERVHDSYVARYPERHPVRVFTQRHLTFALVASGDFDKALAALPQAVANATHFYGTGAFATAECYARWLTCLRHLERWSELIAVGEKYLEECRDTKPDAWRGPLVSILHSLSYAYRKLENYDKAVTFLEAALHYGRIEWGEVDERNMSALRWLSRCKFQQGSLDESLYLLKHVRRVYVATLGASHVRTLKVTSELKQRRFKVSQRKGYARRQAVRRIGALR